MVVRFFDRQQKVNPLNGTVISASKAVHTLNNLRTRDPFFVEFVGDHGYQLLVGLGGDVACAQYSRSDGATPYLMAVNPLDKNEGFLEFLIDDTPTPVAKRYCMDFDQISQIVAHFIETGERSSTVTWEEI